MPVALSKKQRIYYRIEGDRGPFLVLYPPFLETIEGWYRGRYVEQLQDYYRLILIDPLAQGRSDMPLEYEHYTIASRAQNILDIMIELEVETFHFLGIGLGGQVGFFLATNFPERLRSFVMVGVHPYPITTDLQKIQRWVCLLRKEGLSQFIETVKREEQILPEQELAISQGSAEAYALLLEGICQWQGVEEQLEVIAIPGLLITTTKEDQFLAIRDAGRRMPYARYQILPELKYEGGLLAVELVVPHLKEFIRKQR